MQKITIIAVLTIAVIFPTLRAQNREDSPTPDVGKAQPAKEFMKWVENTDTLGPETRDKIRHLSDATGSEGDPDLIARALAIMQPDFQKALKYLNNEKPRKAVKLLEPALESKNPYLASNARFFLARARMQQENYEKAAALLKPLTEEQPPRTQYKPHSLFRLAISQTYLLKRDDALKSVSTFLRNYPHAPALLRDRAKMLFVQLMTYRKGSLKEVCDLMRYSRRRLKLDRLGETTQTRQERVVEILDKMIEEAQKQQNQGGGGGGGGGQGMAQAGGAGGAPSGNSPSGGPANQSQLPGGASSMGELSREVKGRPGETWGNMPPKEREKALSHLKSQFPDRYRDLVEQYYKSLQEEE
ncbi:MAG: tetratricopeptide repeat protein [Planctomycetes bacterium]|nr:tetratricopeptide repeat protein [Planctomycetota bacterium]